MGQRHQIYLNVPNPRKIARDEYKVTKGYEIFPALKKEMILPFHNSWLFGRSAVLSALRVLRHSSILKPNDMLGKPDERFAGLKTPLAFEGILTLEVSRPHEDGQFKNYVNEMENLLNYDYSGEFSEIIGIGRVSNSYVDGLFDKEYFKRITDYCDRGDNNDGITIIDTINNKYCFMNIHERYYDPTEIMESASDLVPYKPCSAMEYMEAYYPDAHEKNNEIADLMKDFEVMTIKEVSKLFPKMEQFKQKQTIK